MKRIIKLSFMLIIVFFVSLLSSCGGYIEVGYNSSQGGYTTATTIVRYKVKSGLSSKKTVEVSYGYKLKQYPLTPDMTENSDLDQPLKFTLYRTLTNNLNRNLNEDDKTIELLSFNEKLDYFLNENFYIENTKTFYDEITTEDLIGYNYLEYMYMIEPINDDHIKWYTVLNGKKVNPRNYGEDSKYWRAACIRDYKIINNAISFG